MPAETVEAATAAEAAAAPLLLPVQLVVPPHVHSPAILLVSTSASESLAWNSTKLTGDGHKQSGSMGSFSSSERPALRGVPTGMIRICMVRGTRLVFSARPHAYTLAASTRKQQRLSSFQRPPAQRHCARISSLAPSANNYPSCMCYRPLIPHHTMEVSQNGWWSLS